MTPFVIKNWKIVAIVAAFIAAFAFGYYLTPTKIKKETEIKEVEVVKEVVKYVERLQERKQTKTVIIEWPDGTKMTEIYELYESTVVVEKIESNQAWVSQIEDEN
jgi:hypothetical protein